MMFPLLTTTVLFLFACFCNAAQTGRVTANSLYVRSAPSQKAAAIGSLPKDSIVTIIGQNGDWYQISQQKKDVTEGYLPSVLIKDGKLRLGAAIRKGPDSTSAEITRLSQNTPVTILESVGPWTKIRTQSTRMAYVHKDFIRTDKEQPHAAPPQKQAQRTAKNASSPAPFSGVARKYGILIYDAAQEREVWSQNPDKSMPIASLTKMMTLLLALEKINGTPGLSLDSEVSISSAAAGVAPTKAYLEAGKTVKLGELLSVMILVSCNDCAAVAGEFIGGSTYGFAKIANARAKQLGMSHTKFFNANGLPGQSQDKDNTSTPRDLLILARELWRYPLARKWVNRQSVEMVSGIPKPRTFKGHTPLLGQYGIDGIKTGYTRRAGSCVATHAKNASGEFFIILLGCESAGTRNTLLEKIMKWLNR